MVWDAEFPIRTSDGRHGRQTFSYSAEIVPLAREARQLALEDVATADAVRHRRGAEVDLGELEVTGRHLDD